MSNPNPYAPTSAQPARDFGIRNVKVRPLGLMKRAYALVGDQYWIFVAITLVGTFVASMVPFGLVAGAMAVGIYLCYIQREAGEQAEFPTLFRGFDFFIESLLAFLVYFIASVAFMFPFMIAIFFTVIGPVLAAAANPGGGPPQMPPTVLSWILILYPLMIVAHILVALPFFFTFQLIADRNFKAMDAVTTSARGVLKNLGGVIWFVIVTGVISSILSMMCFLPLIPVLPLLFGALFLLYRDIYGTEENSPQLPAGVS